ncbi:lysine--tRNA ligase [Candidatus Kaiserbacteria bacterium CG10_big_fil_rev_8_21_14_0_10_59_10]|uniref:Lysine--tRNA ligase n=1 Tax=Candidatus Kaiserbacteria bacterium CG10_big_fil_rev_8_21_14_0_10_59_10 TaxID=1974612 RepID=A0A2H0U715_9BACT|nr:MAG: lysine--tRNA ligase [Candidatus Kaiserbacteria bacterium CG10_big_fil_rev_8_21_14_0_10_59_10]
MSLEAEIRAEREKKLALLRSAGMEPYPVSTERDSTIAELLEEFDALEQSGTTRTIAGRIASIRGQGGITFVDVIDGTARVQLVLNRKEMDAARFDLFQEAVDQSDFIQATGAAFRTKRGERSLSVIKWKMLAKSLRPVPDEWYGVKDEELRLRERYLDILLNEDVRAMFERRAAFWQVIRTFYLQRGFLEVETPVFENSPGGADARPFITHHNALDMDVYLRISLELWHKRLLVAGYPKVFEIGRVFRNEGQSREHLQDYTMLESYEAYMDMQRGMHMVQELYRAIASEVYGTHSFSMRGHAVDLAGQWNTIDYSSAIRDAYGIDPLECTEAEAISSAQSAGVLAENTGRNKARAIDNLWKRLRKDIAGPAFLIGTPVYLEPLAKRSASDERVVERMQVIIAGSEVGKGFSELNDPLDQRARFEEQQKLREGGDEEAQRLDLEYIRAMEYGMPPAFGFGVSERLFAFFEDTPAHESQLFPLLKPRQ